MDVKGNKHALLFGLGLWFCGVAVSNLEIHLSSYAVLVLAVIGVPLVFVNGLGLARDAGIHFWRIPLRDAVQFCFNWTKQGASIGFATPHGELEYQALYLRLDAAAGHIRLTGKKPPSTRRESVPTSEFHDCVFNSELDSLTNIFDNQVRWTDLRITRPGVWYHLLRLKLGWTEGQKPIDRGDAPHQ